MSIWIVESGYPNAGKKMQLLTLAQLRNLQVHAPCAELTSIFGEKVKVRDCDDDTRYGFVAYGQVMQ